MKAFGVETVLLDDDAMCALRARAEADLDQYLRRREIHRGLDGTLRLLKKARSGRGRGPNDWSHFVTSGCLAALIAAAENESDCGRVSILPSLRRVESLPLDAVALDAVEHWLDTLSRYSKGRQGRKRGREFFIALHLSYEFTGRFGELPKVSTSEQFLDGPDDVVSLFDVTGLFVRFARAFADDLGERALRDAVREGRYACCVLLEFGIAPPPYRSLQWVEWNRTRESVCERNGGEICR